MNPKLAQANAALIARCKAQGLIRTPEEDAAHAAKVREEMRLALQQKREKAERRLFEKVRLIHVPKEFA